LARLGALGYDGGFELAVERLTVVGRQASQPSSIDL
jgi:hypothetical protein